MWLVTGLQTVDPLESHICQVLPVTTRAENLLFLKKN